MSRIADALPPAIARLAAAGVADPAGDARRLMAHVLGVAPGRLTPMQRDPLPDAAARRFDAAIAARAERRPVSHITGRRAFWGHDFATGPEVLDPRPETETLVAAALETEFGTVLDLGTGSGCILLSLLAERPAARGTGTDLSEAALEVARRNAREMELAARAEFVAANWLEAVTGRYDLIVSNPPYIAAAEMAALAPEVRDWEPSAALTPGGDGLAAYRAIAHGAAQHLAPGGQILLEIGPTQAEAVCGIFAAAGFAGARIHRDFDARDRVVHFQVQIGTLSPSSCTNWP